RIRVFSWAPMSPLGLRISIEQPPSSMSAPIPSVRPRVAKWGCFTYSLEGGLPRRGKTKSHACALRRRKNAAKAQCYRFVAAQRCDEKSHHSAHSGADRGRYSGAAGATLAVAPPAGCDNV